MLALSTSSAVAAPVSWRSSSGSKEPAGFDEREQATVEAIGALRRPRGAPRDRVRLRESVVRWNLPLARRLARGYQHRGECLDDLLQVAALALVKAVDGFDPERGKSFTGYATPTILGELKRHFRDRVWSVHVPRGLQERCLEATRVRAELAQELHRPPTAAEVADVLGVTEAQVRATEASTSAYRAESLNRPIGAEPDGAERMEMLGALDQGFERSDDGVTLGTAIDRLAPRARLVVRRYFFDNCTQIQIAAELQTSQMTVSRLLAQALAELRARLEDREPTRSGGEPVTVPARLYDAERGCVVATVNARTVSAGLDPAGAARLRDMLVGVVTSRRPRMLVVDLRHVARPAPALARVLLDVYRGCGTTGVHLCVINADPGTYDLLRRAGLIRLFPCRPAAPTAPETARATSAGTESARPSVSGYRAARPVCRPAMRHPKIELKRPQVRTVLPRSDGAGPPSGRLRPPAGRRHTVVALPRPPYGGRRSPSLCRRWAEPATRNRSRHRLARPPPLVIVLVGDGRPVCHCGPVVERPHAPPQASS